MESRKVAKAKKMRFFNAVYGTSLFLCLILLMGGSVAMAKNEMIQLPEPVHKGTVSLEESIQKRRSQRAFTDKELNLGQISQLLWSAQGITGGKSFRAAPSAGALYPIEIYLATKEGLFHYIPDGHALEVISRKDMRVELALAAFGQGCVEKAAADIIICAKYSRVMAKYGGRGEQYVHIEVGHAAQNVHLQVVALGLGSVPVGAFDDEAVKKVCSMPKECEPLYIIPVGHTAR